jgi:hypothetical protein
MVARSKLLIHGSPEVLKEIERLLRDVNVPSEPCVLIANSADAGAFHVLSVGLGAGLTLVAQALIAFIRRKSGQRRIVVQWDDHKSDCIKRIEVESPQLAELEDLLAKAQDVFAVDSSSDKAVSEKEIKGSASSQK